MMGREQLLPHLLVINLLLLFLQKGEKLIVANSIPILLKHLMLRSLVLRVLRSLALCPTSLPPHTLSTAQEEREPPLPSILVKSILNSMGKENLRPMGSVDISGGLEVFKIERSITGLIPPFFFGTKKRQE
jgi:hypothetical protein